MTERQGIEIDFCPNCRGVWLDRGELDKIIEKSNVVPSPEDTRSAQPQQGLIGTFKNHYHKDDDYKYKHKRKKSFLEELFD
jgi:uncharacterized protein